MPKSWILVSSDHNTFTQFSSESLADFRRACTCAFLSTGTLRALQDFSPPWRSVLSIVFLVTVVPASLRSLTRSSRVVLGWFLIVLIITETPRGEILHVPVRAPVREILTVIFCFFHLWITAPTVVTFSPSCLAMVLLLIPAFYVSLQSPWRPWTQNQIWPSATCSDQIWRTSLSFLWILGLQSVFVAWYISVIHLSCPLILGITHG